MKAVADSLAVLAGSRHEKTVNDVDRITPACDYENNTEKGGGPV